MTTNKTFPTFPDFGEIKNEAARNFAEQQAAKLTAEWQALRTDCSAEVADRIVTRCLALSTAMTRAAEGDLAPLRAIREVQK